jgi:superfamily II DNA or RNA helicase
MKCRLEGKFAYLTEYTSDEIKFIEKRLLWEDKNGNSTSLLFYENQEFRTKPHIFYGLVEPLQLVSPFQITIENPTIVEHDIVDIPVDYLPGIELEPHQIAAARKAISWKRGINIIGTGGGKTEIMLVIIKYLLESNKITKGVVLVPNVALADQFYNRALDRQFSKDKIAVLHGNSKPKGTESIIIGVVNSISNVIKNTDHYLHDFIINCDLLMEDEAHHSRSVSWMNIALSTNPKYFLLYTGSAFKETTIWEDSGDCLLYGLAGRICFELPSSYLVTIGRNSRPVVFFKTIPGRMLKYPQNWMVVYNNFIVKHKIRNNHITQYANKFANLKFKVLILVQRLDHAKEIMMSLKHRKVVCIFGGQTSLQFDEFGVIEEVPIDYSYFRTAFENDAWEIVIGSQVMNEGFDLPSVECLIQAGGGKSRISNLQKIGRSLRKKKLGRNDVYIIDFYDKSHIFLASHSKKRIQLFTEISPVVPENETEFWKIVIAHSLELQKLKNEK